MTGAVCFMIACKLFGEKNSVTIEDLLESLGDHFTLEEFINVERRLCIEIAKENLCSILPSSICE